MYYEDKVCTENINYINNYGLALCLVKDLISNTGEISNMIILYTYFQGKYTENETMGCESVRSDSYVCADGYDGFYRMLHSGKYVELTRFGTELA